MSSARPINRIISKFGEPVTVRPRTTVVDPATGAATHTFPEGTWWNTKILLYDASGLREEWYVIGIDEQTDYVASFYAYLKDTLSIHDQVELLDGTLTEIINIVKRGKGTQIDHVEVLMRRI